MHAAGMWTAFAAIMAGTPWCSTTRTKLDPQSVLADRRAREGRHDDDGRATPTPRRWSRNCGDGRYDLSSLYAIGTGGAATNPKYQRALLELLPHITLINGYGSSETGNMGFGHSQRRHPDRHLRRCARAGWCCPRTTAGFFGPGSTRSAGWREPGESRWATSTIPTPPARPFPQVDGQRVVISGDRAHSRPTARLRLLRPGLAGGQHRRGEGLRRRGRRGAARAPRGRRRAGGRAAQRSLGRRDRRAGRTARWQPMRYTTYCTRTARRSWRGSRRPRSSSSSTRSIAWATARPTTGGRKPQATAKGADVDMNASPVIDCLVNVHFGETETATHVDAEGPRRLLQGTGVDVRAGRPGRAARRDGRARRAQGRC